MVLRMLAMAPKLFKAGVAMASISDWRYYDTAYTERFMGPYDKDVYWKASALRLARQIPNHKLLMIHGMSDFNALPQNTMAMSKLLFKYKKYFRHELRPKEEHHVNYLLSMLRFFKKTLYGFCHRKHKNGS